MDYKELPILLAPYVKGKVFDPAPLVTNGIPDYADGAKNPKVIGTAVWEEFWSEQLHRCMNGYNTGGVWIPGRYYYFANFKKFSIFMIFYLDVYLLVKIKELVSKLYLSISLYHLNKHSLNIILVLLNF